MYGTKTGGAIVNFDFCWFTMTKMSMPQPVAVTVHLVSVPKLSLRLIAAKDWGQEVIALAKYWTSTVSVGAASKHPSVGAGR